MKTELLGEHDAIVIIRANKDGDWLSTRVVYAKEPEVNDANTIAKGIHDAILEITQDLEPGTE